MGRTESIFFVFGNLFNCFLHGALSVQIYLYYLAFPKDRAWTKAAVYAVYLLETIHVIGLAIILAFILLGDGKIIQFWHSGIEYVEFGYRPSALFAHALLVNIVGATVALIAQCIYAHQIQLLTGKEGTPWLIFVLAVVQFIAAASTVGRPFAHYVWSAPNAMNDLIIAVVMIRTLLKQKMLSRYTRSKVMYLIFLIFGTGILTVVVNLAALALFATGRYITSFLSTTITIFMPKLYANSILVVLNNRMTIGDSSLKPESSNAESLNAVSTFALAAAGAGN